jgi:hypothetical protein
MMAMSPMEPRSRREGRRWLLSTYRIPPSNKARFFQFSTNWGGRWRADGRQARSIGVQFGAFGRAVCVIAWPPQIARVLTSSERIEIERAHRRTA